MLSASIPLHDLAATRALAAQLAPLLRIGDTIALRGNLGTGKTEFARALLRALGVSSDIPSPTFTLLQTYDVTLGKTPIVIAHFDLYRLKNTDELDELGWDDACSDGVALVEWPERAESRMSANTLTLALELCADGSRVCALYKNGSWHQRL